MSLRKKLSYLLPKIIQSEDNKFYKGKTINNYRLSFIKNDSNYNIIKTDIKNRLSKLSIIRGNFSIKDKFRLFFYKYFNKISFYFKLKD